ncbi:MAG TPA: invasion associated locus B family protein [Rhizomicrobium sp.]|nr:invasion associated locus B family protein [Rhizomicrobium sp.]
MRNMIVGAVLAVALVAGLFALAHYNRPQIGMQDPTAVAAEVQPGFIGTKSIGPWLLICKPGPKAGGNNLGHCQLSLIYHRKENPKQVVLILTFRVQGDAQHLVAIVVVPPIVKQGDVMTMQAGNKLLKLPISVCKKTECAAAVTLAPKGEADLLSVPSAALFFPPAANGKRSGVPVPFVGLPAAVDALRRAER